MKEKEEFIDIQYIRNYNYLKEFYFPNNILGKYFILYITQGSISLNSNNLHYNLTQNSITFMPYAENSYFKTINSNYASFSFIIFSGKAAELFYSEMQNNAGIALSPFSDIPSIINCIINFSKSILQKDKTLKNKYLCKLLNELLFEEQLYSETLEIPQHIVAIRNLFHERLNYPYLLNELSKITHINKFKIIKDFKKYYNISPMKYLSELRLKTAKNLLLSTSLTIKEISEKTGFTNPNYFVHFFKTKTKLSPTEFRKTHKNE